MGEKIFEVVCSSCGRDFLMAGSIESVSDDLCLDCFVEEYGQETGNTIEETATGVLCAECPDCEEEARYIAMHPMSLAVAPLTNGQCNTILADNKRLRAELEAAKKVADAAVGWTISCTLKMRFIMAEAAGDAEADSAYRVMVGVVFDAQNTFADAVREYRALPGE